MRRGALLFAAGLVVAAAVPVVGSALRRLGVARCALDGVRVTDATRARARLAGGCDLDFCGPECLARRLRDPALAGAAATVTDEATGREVDAASAWFVASAVTSVPANGSRLHAFAREEDARRHAAAHHGTVWPGPGLAGTAVSRGSAP
jgi:hypothetical protein